MKVGICTLGCKVNIYESEHVIALLKEHNYDIVGFDDYADIYIINTCTVTNQSDRKSRKMVNSCKAKNKDAIVVVMGCHSQIKGDSLNADIVLGVVDKSKIIELLEKHIEAKKQIKLISDLKNAPFESYSVKEFTKHTRAFVKIQDGCDAFCSYCIIPYARGPIRSKKLEEVISEVEYLVDLGYKEIVLVGIHTGKYGKDISSSLEELLKKLLEIKNLYRLRISSIEINEITDKILEMIKNNRVVAKHLHIPLQSGCDKILKLMNRKYTTNEFKAKIDKIRASIPDISITSDVIVGFPSESEEDFENTYKFIEDIKLTKLHVFPYSSREGTPSSIMPDQIESKIKKERVRKLINLSTNLEKEYNTNWIGKEVEIIIDNIKDDKTLGFSSNYIEIMTNKKYKKNTIIKGKIKDFTNNIGVLENEKNISK